MEQQEIRIGLKPIELTISRHYKQCTKIGININRFAFNMEFVYEKPQKQ